MTLGETKEVEEENLVLLLYTEGQALLVFCGEEGGSSARVQAKRGA